MKHLVSFLVMLTMVGVMMAETRDLTATFGQENVDTKNNGYQVVLGEDNLFFLFEVNGVSQLEAGTKYLYSDMLQDSTCAYRLVRTSGGMLPDSLNLVDCWLMADGNGNYTAMVKTSADSFNIAYTKPLRVEDLSLTNDSGFVQDKLATDSLFQIVATSGALGYTLGLTIKGVSQISGMYFTSDVMVHDSAMIKTYTRLRYWNGEKSEMVDFRALAPMATVVTLSDKAFGAVEYLGMDSVLYNIAFQCTIKKTTAIDNVAASSCIAYTEGGVIVLAGAEGKLATVYDMAGRMVCRREAGADVERIEVGAKGVYFIQVNNQTIRVVVR